jgi:hypothetical protein
MSLGLLLLILLCLLLALGALLWRRSSFWKKRVVNRVKLELIERSTAAKAKVDDWRSSAGVECVQIEKWLFQKTMNYPLDMRDEVFRFWIRVKHNEFGL